MTSEDLCLYDVADGIATLTFNRPDSMNGMTGDMEVAYFERLQQAEADPDVRVIVVTGAGRAFCPGADLAHRPGPDDQPLPNNKLARTLPLDIAKPMIAAINGACAGVGMAYALQCDLRFATTKAKFTTAFSRRGLIGEYGMAWLLHAIAGREVAMDLLLSARVVQGSEAADLGIISAAFEPHDLMAHVHGYARDLAANASPASMATIKRQINVEPAMSVHQATEHAEGLMRQSLAGTDVQEGIASFLEKRQVAFPPLGQGSTFEWDE